jgi:hypothetical protein
VVRDAGTEIPAPKNALDHLVDGSHPRKIAEEAGGGEAAAGSGQQLVFGVRRRNPVEGGRGFTEKGTRREGGARSPNGSSLTAHRRA